MPTLYHPSTLQIIDFGNEELAAYRIVASIAQTEGTQLYTVKEGDSLVSIASRLFGNAQEWYRIADANEIINPFDLEVGMTLKIPEALNE
tara:strand:- start:274 stop:543 length:270 start_codon:yes stop_codon:yes gene_type:complete